MRRYDIRTVREVLGIAGRFKAVEAFWEERTEQSIIVSRTITVCTLCWVEISCLQGRLKMSTS